jgi:hypothetical protein
VGFGKSFPSKVPQLHYSEIPLPLWPLLGKCRHERKAKQERSKFKISKHELAMDHRNGGVDIPKEDINEAMNK